jgi:N-hydroxyarylamine O-acetyltransferase
VEQPWVEEYLERIHAPRPAGPSGDGLRSLHAAHLHAVPFENLSIHIGEVIRLDQEALLDKLLTRTRGGFCYELNGGFALLLGALGFDVTMLAARVFAGDDFGPPFDHLVLRVDTAEPWLADVGFGKHSLYPLRLSSRSPQEDPDGQFTVAETPDGDLDVSLDGKPQYRVELRPRRIRDFEPTCWWHQTSPKSHFTRSLTCSLRTKTGRITLSDRLLIETRNGQRKETELTGDAEVLAAYQAYFGIRLERVPHLGRPV